MAKYLTTHCARASDAVRLVESLLEEVSTSSADELELATTTDIATGLDWALPHLRRGALISVLFSRRALNWIEPWDAADAAAAVVRGVEGRWDRGRLRARRDQAPTAAFRLVLEVAAASGDDTPPDWLLRLNGAPDACDFQSLQRRTGDPELGPTWEWCADADEARVARVLERMGRVELPSELIGWFQIPADEGWRGCFDTLAASGGLLKENFLSWWTLDGGLNLGDQGGDPSMPNLRDGAWRTLLGLMQADARPRTRLRLRPVEWCAGGRHVDGLTRTLSVEPARRSGLSVEVGYDTDHESLARDFVGAVRKLGPWEWQRHR